MKNLPISTVQTINFNKDGLIPAVVQDTRTSEVLMVAWMNLAALTLTQETGEAHFWSRSRKELWHKGSTSGNFLRIQEILVDCDADTLLLQVIAVGPACHTGAQSCFYQELEQQQTQGKVMLRKLFEIIEDRKKNPTDGSYTVQLFSAGEDKILQKVGEEAVEVILAAKGQGKQRIIEETADLIYHTLVMLSAKEITLEDVENELRQRHR